MSEQKTPYCAHVHADAASENPPLIRKISLKQRLASYYILVLVFLAMHVRL